MSLGGGHIQDMINKMKANADMIKRKRLFKKGPRFSEHSLESNLERKPLTESEKQAIKNKIQKEYKSEQIRSILAFIFALLVVGFLVRYFIKNYL